MEIKIDRNELLKAVSRVQSIIERKSNMPVLSTILFSTQTEEGNVRLSATDLELGFQEAVDAEVVQEGSITISGRKLFEILKESNAELFHIKVKDNSRVSITDGVARFELACISADEFPTFMEPEAVDTIAVEGETLCEMISKTIYAVTLEEAGFKLSGVYTEKRTDDQGTHYLRMVATDGHRLSLIDKSFPGLETLDLGSGVMIPKKGMSELNKMGSEGGVVALGFKDKRCIARREKTLLIMRLLETKFPDYEAVIPAGKQSSFLINRIALLEGMRKMLILSNERYRAVKVTLENNQLDLMSTNPELGEAEENMAVEYNGIRIEAGFNPKYFIEVLQSMASESVSLFFSDSSKPCVIKGELDTGFIGLIMPMRV
ncbi:MAG: DNA polymerase III subunit beta [Deltaproteobacteria bacterium]|nr:DNA polymerase III subunit beta [Deltaproteobacteria bacterium]